ncbi:LysM peptidoglycan-binding domain-containing protein [Actinacidiphila glaucinigra]|uniref:LysM peptidoglycan-binding domain-containing protein n=1 Tax=Actinacidiphila glaucinigra TaxID=235986 RepID=UPI0037CAF3D0
MREHDTIAAIARRLNVSWQELAAVNGIAAPYIYPRQELTVPGLVVIDVPPFPGAKVQVLTGSPHGWRQGAVVGGSWTRPPGPTPRILSTLLSPPVTSPSGAQKSVLAGVDIGRWCGYCFSRSPEGPEGPAETNCRSAVSAVQLVAVCRTVRWWSSEARAVAGRRRD